MAAFQTLLGLASGAHGPTTYDRRQPLVFSGLWLDTIVTDDPSKSPSSPASTGLAASERRRLERQSRAQPG